VEFIIFLRSKFIWKKYIKYNNNLFKLIIQLLEATFLLTPGCHGGSQLPVDTFDKYVN